VNHPRLSHNTASMGSIVGAPAAWQGARGVCPMIYFYARRHGLPYLVASALLVFFAVDAGLYYSHRWLHGRWLFRHVHRWHHRFVAPIVFTTTAVHPIEFLVFEAFLILPAFVIPVHAAVYLLLVAYTYFVGMIDHWGVRVRWPLPLHGNNQFHDDHHVHFHCNYGHHTAIFDRLHDTVRRDDRSYGEEVFGGKGAPLDGTAIEKPATLQE